MKIYNTLSRKKQEFQTIESGKVRMYACGPTVYNYIHIGNARPIIVFDVLRNYLEYSGYQVCFVQNFTDVDDKIIQKAKQEQVSAAEIAERFIEAYHTDAAGLGVRAATIHPRVTHHIDAIIQTVEALMNNGFAYEVDGDVYFRTHQFQEYGKLSHMPLEDLSSGARIAVGDKKENPLDFVLWKRAKSGEPSWNSPWGEGRPGWHIECTAMAQKYLGETIDLHCGGQDLVFPHHENEVAQSEAASGEIFAHYWMHNGYINVDNKKMSKSAGNFFTVRDIAQQFGYEPIRFMMLQAHYRTPINYSPEMLEQCKSALERLYQCKRTLAHAVRGATSCQMSQSQKESLLQHKQNFIRAMEDDLNTADAIAAIFELVREINVTLGDSMPQSKEYIAFAAQLFEELTGVLGLLYEQAEEVIPQEVKILCEQRAEARKAKDFTTADRLRDEILAHGYELQEGRNGTRITKKR